MNRHTLFVSYSSLDGAFVQRLATDLRAAGAYVWIDLWELKVGDSIVEKINRAIQGSDYLIAVLSKNSVASKWVAEELNAATVRKIEGRRAFILPVMLETVDLPPLLSHLKYADFRASYDSGLQSLLDVLMPGADRTSRRDERRHEVERLAVRLKELERQVSDFGYDVGYDSDSDPDEDERGLCDRIRSDYEDAVEQYRQEFGETYDPYGRRR